MRVLNDLEGNEAGSNNMNNVKYADDAVLMADSKENLAS